MRFTRTITLLVAALTATLLGLSVAPSQAAPSVGQTAAVQYHVVNNLSAGEIRNSGKFKVSGNAITYKGKKVILQRKNPGGAWRTYTRKATSVTTGHFRIRFDGRCGSAWRIVLKASGPYAKTTIKIGRIRCY
jgi:hypothetical protein